VLYPWVLRGIYPITPVGPERDIPYYTRGYGRGTPVGILASLGYGRGTLVGILASLGMVGSVHPCIYALLYTPGYTDHATRQHTGTRRTTVCTGLTALTRKVAERTVSDASLTVGSLLPSVIPVSLLG